MRAPTTAATRKPTLTPTAADEARTKGKATGGSAHMSRQTVHIHTERAPQPTGTHPPAGRPGARGGRRRGAAARCAGRDRVRPAPSLSPRPGPEGRPSPAERAEHRPVTSLRGVGAALAERLARLSVRRVSDLLFVLPLRYEDRTQLTAI